MVKNKVYKRPKKPKVPYRPVRGVMAKRILVEKKGVWCKNKPFKLDIPLTDIFEELPPDVQLEDIHILVESFSEDHNCNFVVTVYVPEVVQNPNIVEDTENYNKKLGTYTNALKDYNLQQKQRRILLKDTKESKPKRAEVNDEDIPTKINVKNRNVK